MRHFAHLDRLRSCARLFWFLSRPILHLPRIQVARCASQPEPWRVLAGAAVLLLQPCGQTPHDMTGAAAPITRQQKTWACSRQDNPGRTRAVKLHSEFLHEGHPMRKMLTDFKCMDKRKCEREKSAEIAGEIRSPRKILETPAKHTWKYPLLIWHNSKVG